MNTNRLLPFITRGYWRIYALAFVAGAAVMSLELVASRLLIPVFGGSIYTWGSLIGVILTGLSLGYHIGGRLADKEPRFPKLCAIIFSAGLYIIFIPFITPMVMDFSDSIAVENEYAPLLATFMLLLLPTMLLGIVSPYAIKLATNTLSNLGNIAGNLYSLSTIGSIVGTFLTVFALIPTLEVRQIIFGLGLVLMIASSLGLSKFPKALTFLVIVLIFFPSSSLVLGLVSHSGKLIYEKETPYSHLDITDFGNTRTLYLNGLPHSRMYIDRPNELAFTYTKYFHMGMLLNPNVENVLFVGGGGFSGPKNFLVSYPDLKVDVVEIDPDVIAAAKEYFTVNENPNLSIFNEDARNFLSNTDQKYDIIILDAFSKSYVPFHLMTLEYFELLKEKMRPNGVVISNLPGSLVGDTSDLFRDVYKTMKQVFPTLYIFTTEHNTWSVQNLMVLATNTDKQYSKYELRKLASDTDINASLDSVDYLDHLYDSEIKTDEIPLLTDQFAPVENLINPVTSKPYVFEENSDSRKLNIPWSENANVTIVLLLVIAVIWIFYMMNLMKRDSSQVREQPTKMF